MVMASDLLRRRTLAEARDVLVLPGPLLASPRVICARDLGDVGFGQVTVNAIDQHAHLPGVDEQGLLPPVAELPVALVPGEEPQARGNLCAIEQLSR